MKRILNTYINTQEKKPNTFRHDPEFQHLFQLTLKIYVLIINFSDFFLIFIHLSCLLNLRENINFTTYYQTYICTIQQLQLVMSW